MCDGYPDGLTVKINDQVINMQEYGTVDTLPTQRKAFFSTPTTAGCLNLIRYQEKSKRLCKLSWLSVTSLILRLKLPSATLDMVTKLWSHALTDSLLRSRKTTNS